MVSWFPYWSKAVMVRLLPAPAVGVVVAAERVRLPLVSAAFGLTVTDRPEPLLMEPSVTVIELVTAL